MGFWDTLGDIAAVGAAPLTGGASLAIKPVAKALKGKDPKGAVAGLVKPASVPQSWWDEQTAELQRQADVGTLTQEEIARWSSPSWPTKKFGKLPPEEQQRYNDAPKSKAGTPEYLEELKLKDAEAVREENKAKWEGLANLPLNSLKSVYGLNDQEASEAHDRFVEAVNGYVDPAFEAALPDLVSQAATAQADPEAIAAQKDALGKATALTGIQETAEEKFMREQARRTQERDLRSQRGADKNSLLARGAYGSGAEIAMAGQAQQEASERRALEEMGANANAQQRALAAIGRMGTISGQMRDSSFAEESSRGTAADRIREGNRKYKEDYNEWKRGEQVKDEEGKVERAGLIKDDLDRARTEADKRASALWGAETDVTAGSTGQYSGDSAPVAGAFGSQGSLAFNRDVQEDIDEDADSFNVFKPGTWF
jgi:hypothetical protein